jgi:hypothetical protein
LWIEGLGKLEKFNDLIRNQTRDLPTCNIVPQPTALLLKIEDDIDLQDSYDELFISESFIGLEN